MSLPVVFDPGAITDRQDIEDYLAVRFSASNASLYIGKVSSACYKIGLAPFRGTKRDGVRSVGFERRISILFEIEAEAVVIL